MSYRPITDVWILARSKVKYYGAYPAGFLHRGRQLLGVGRRGAVLHVCAGKIREYPFRGLGRFDKTLDLNRKCKPDFLRDARRPFPKNDGKLWNAVMIDRPYTEPDADNYPPGRAKLPTVHRLLRNALRVVPKGGCVGILDYEWPAPPRFDDAREVAVVAVGTGRRGRARWYTVWERLK